MQDFDANEDTACLPGAAPGGPGAGALRGLMTLARNLDVALVVVATPVVLAMGAPAFGYLVGAVAWILQSVVRHADQRLVVRAAEPRTRLGLTLFEAFGRIWLLAGAIVLAGVAGGRSDGLTAALVIFAAYSVAFAIRVLSGRPTPPTTRERGMAGTGEAARTGRMAR
jgi:hypothetical protein